MCTLRHQESIGSSFGSIGTFLGSVRTYPSVGTLNRHLGYLLVHRPQLTEGYIDLPSHFGSLGAYRFESSVKQIHLKTTNRNQKQIEPPIRPVRPVSLWRVYRHRGKFADSYGMLCIFGMLFVAIALGWPTAVCFSEGWPWQGFSLAGCALILNLSGCLSGIIGCLPWTLWACLHDGQEHSQSEYLHNVKIVPLCRWRSP
jgi:hypothetical protein